MEVDEINECLLKFHVLERKNDGIYFFFLLKKTNLLSVEAALDHHKCVMENNCLCLFRN